MARKRRLQKRYRRNPETSSRSNPPLFQELAEFIGPGFASFAATRLLTRIAATQLARRKPSWGKHAGALASLASFAALWWGAHRVKWLAKYHTPLVVGSGLAALQSLVQLYIPQLGWMVSDATPQIAEEQNLQLESNGGSAKLVAGMEYLDEDPDEYSYNDAFDPGVATKPPAGSPKASDDEIINDLNMENDELGDLHLGSLGRT